MLGKQRAPKWYYLYGKRGRRNGGCIMTKIAEVSHETRCENEAKRRRTGQTKIGGVSRQLRLLNLIYNIKKLIYKKMLFFLLNGTNTKHQIHIINNQNFYLQ
ncbi:hypothetical protein ST44_04460 [Prevotella pectinovora]|uniref:Uncharacterized protein n=1 Tax=Prevotella pectinovora TaxID=1602169 RepID=A0A0D0HDT3_9BACT|nr:hypothetical protein ST44_04460 [Prevotella pectinovora]